MFDPPWSRPDKSACDPASRSWLTSSGDASYPTAPSEGGALTGLPMTTRRIANLSTDPAYQEPKSSIKAVRCSAALLGRTTLASRFASAGPKTFGSRVALEEDPRFRRLIPSGTASAPKSLGIACRRRSDLWSPAAPSCRCRLSGEAGTAVPIT